MKCRNDKSAPRQIIKENDNSVKSTNLNRRDEDMPFQISNIVVLFLILFSNYRFYLISYYLRDRKRGNYES